MSARPVLQTADIARALRRIAHEILEARRGDGPARVIVRPDL